MSRWFRLYADVLDDPKVQRLPPLLFKTWVNLLCLASRHEGMLPAMEDIAFALRLDDTTCGEHIRNLVERGLLDAGECLRPHNWDTRQFKSDKDETATDRKRAQRARDKHRDQPGEVTNDVTDDVTRDVTDVSRPPEQSRTDTEQSRAEQTRAHTEGEISREVQGYLDRRADDLTQWEVEFLMSIKWADTLSKAQIETFKGIRQKLAPRDGATPLPSVKRGTPAYDAWIAYYRRRGPATFYEKLDAFTVPSEFPPEEKAA